MQIDWFTFIAQVVNFVVLMLLLRRFLYGPIVKAMDRREAAIAERLEEARRLQAQAEQEAAVYRDRQEALEQQRTALVASMREEVATKRKALLHEAREEVATVQEQWREAVLRQQSVFLQELRHRTTTQVVAVVRQLLDDLAEASLEEQVVRVFLTRLAALEGVAATAAETALGSADGVVVRSAFPFPEPERNRLADALQRHGADVRALRFETAPALGLGLEVRAGGWKFVWSLDGYLETLETRLAEALAEMKTPAAEIHDDNPR